MGRQVHFAAAGQDLEALFRQILDQGFHIWNYTNELTGMNEIVETFNKDRVWIVHDESVLTPQYGKIGYSSDAVEINRYGVYGYWEVPVYLSSRIYLESFRFMIYGQAQPDFMLDMYYRIVRTIKKCAVDKCKDPGRTIWILPEAKSFTESNNLKVV